MFRGPAIAALALALAACKYTGRDPAAADAPPGTPDGPPVIDGDPNVIDAEPVDAEPDAMPTIVTLTFGEGVGADVTGVTSDSYIESAFPLDNRGASAIIWADAAPITNGLLRFDLTSLPPGTQVVAVELVLTTTLDMLETGTVQIYPVIQAWAENQTTWTNRTTAAAWNDAGAGPPGSRGPTLVGEFFPNAQVTPFTVALDLATVQGWIDDPATNDGIILISTSPAGNGTTFSSSNDTLATARPALEISYLQP